MIKLNKQVEALERILEKIEDKQRELEEKIEAVQDAACDDDRDLTKAEENRILKLQEQIDELEDQADDVQNAIDYLSDYCDSGGQNETV